MEIRFERKGRWWSKTEHKNPTKKKKPAVWRSKKATDGDLAGEKVAGGEDLLLRSQLPIVFSNSSTPSLPFSDVLMLKYEPGEWRLEPQEEGFKFQEFESNLIPHVSSSIP